MHQNVDLKPAAIYHFWSNHEELYPGRNLRIPIILSIATLRAFNKSMPIYVLDITDPSTPQADWEDYPKQLNFEVVKWKPELLHYKPYAFGWEICSRFFDVEKFAKSLDENLIIYMDSDVFWLKDPIPVTKDPTKFCFNGYNNGFFYYQKDTDAVNRFFEVYKAFTITALNDDNFRYVSRQFAWYNYEAVFVFDEAISSYMHRRMPHLFNTLDSYDHFTGQSIYTNKDNVLHLNVDQCKMIHSNSLIIKNITKINPWERDYARGLLCMMIKQLFDAVSSTIDLPRCVTHEEWSVYTNLQVPFSNELLAALAKQGDEGRCYEVVSAVQSLLK